MPPFFDSISKALAITLQKLIEWSLASGFRIVVVLVAALVLNRIGRRFVERAIRWVARIPQDPVAASAAQRRVQTLVQLAGYTWSTLVAIVAGLMIFRELHFDVGPILAGAGVVGVAVGFGAQTLIRDVLNGAFIIVENQFSVCDIVKIGDRTGTVEAVNLRTTILREDSGAVHIIPNGTITQVTVFTRDWSQVLLDLSVSYGTDLHRARGIFHSALDRYAAENASTVLGPPQILGLESIANNSLTLRAMVKTVPGQQWDVARALRDLVKTKFDAEGIEIRSLTG